MGVNYEAEWEDHRELLTELLRLEESGASVVWPSLDDRATIQATVRGDIISTIAQEMRTGVAEVPPQEPQASEGILDTVPYPAGPQLVLEEGMQHLIDLLDLESSGINVPWMEPQDRARATEARLAQLQTLSRLDASPVLPEDATVEIFESPELRVEQERTRPAMSLFHDDFTLDAKRLRRG